MSLFYKATVVLNTIILLFCLSISILAIVSIATFERGTDVLFTRGDFAWLLVGGMIGMGVSILGCYGARNPVEHYNLLFCYFFFLSITLFFLCIGFYLYRIFVKDLEAAADGDVESAFRLESAKEFNDLLLSVYTACCTGCNQVILGRCVTEIEPLVPDLCASVSVDGSGECSLQDLCDEDQLARNAGLNQGCTINSAVVPSYEIGDNFCIFFSEFATDKGGNDIVGPAANGQCGGGDPKVFVDRVNEFIGKNYIVIVSFWAIGIIFLTFAWLGALFMLLCPHRYEELNK